MSEQAAPAQGAHASLSPHNLAKKRLRKTRRPANSYARKYAGRDAGWTVFVSAKSFWVLASAFALVAIFLALLIPGLLLTQSPKIGFAIKYGLLPFLAAQIVYLTLTKRWAQFKRWLVWQFVKLRDRMRSITIHPQLTAKRISAKQDEGVFITMAPASKLLGVDTQKITYKDDRHVTLIAGSRAGKGRSVILPNLAHHKGSVIAYDPSGELVRETARYRQEVLGQKIIVLDPFCLSGFPSDCWNPMSEIDFDHDPFAIDKCYLLAESIHHKPSPDPFWTDAPRKMLAMCMAYVGTRSILERCNLGSVRDLLMTSDPAALWMAMSQNDAYGGLIARFGASNENRHVEELNSTMELSRTAMKWLDSPVIEEFTRKSTFSMRELKEDKVTIYVVLPAAQGEAYKAWLRLLFNAAFDVMQDVSIPKPQDDVLFLMDEFPLLGRMDRIKRAAGEAAKFGVKLFIAAQDITQLKEHYGDAWESFIANSGLLIMFANNDLESQHYLSNRLGKE